MQRRQWSRTDQVFLEGLLWALPAVALLKVVLDAVRALRGRPLEVTGSLPDGLVPTPDLVTGPVRGTVVLQDASATQYGWDLVPSVILLLLAVVVARLLLGVTRSLRDGDPFTTANAARLRTLAIVLVVGGAMVPFVQAVAFEGVLDPLLPGPPGSGTRELHLWPSVSGMLVFFLSEVFSRGARLREDVEGLV